MLISRTPYRFSLFGGGLDYPEWFKYNPSRILCAGLDYYCYQTLRELPPFFSDYRYRICYSDVEMASQIDDIRHPSVREAFRKYGDNKRLELTHVGDLPAKSGIGSSSSFTVGLILSLCAMNGQFLGRSKLAEAAIDLEQNYMKEKVGIQDQCAAAFGGLISIEADKEGIRPRRFIAKPEYLNYIQSSLLMGFDGIDRFSQKASSKFIKSIRQDTNQSLLYELESASSAGIDSFGSEKEIDQLAELTRVTRDIKLQLNGDSTNNNTKEIIETTEAAGSLCTRVIGAGGGGFFVCWAPPSRHQRIKDSINIKTWVDVRFGKSGSQLIFSES